MHKDIFLKISAFNFIFGPLFFMATLFIRDAISFNDGSIQLHAEDCTGMIYFIGPPLLIFGIFVCFSTLRLYKRTKGIDILSLTSKDNDHFILISVASGIYLFFTAIDIYGIVLSFFR